MAPAYLCWAKETMRGLEWEGVREKDTTTSHHCCTYGVCGGGRWRCMGTRALVDRP